MADERYYYDIFSSDDQGFTSYEGTIHFDMRGLPERVMYEAASEILYPILPYRKNVQFVEQNTPEWQKIIDSFK